MVALFYDRFTEGLPFDPLPPLPWNTFLCIPQRRKMEVFVGPRRSVIGQTDGVGGIPR